MKKVTSSVVGLGKFGLGVAKVVWEVSKFLLMIPLGILALVAVLIFVFVMSFLPEILIVGTLILVIAIPIGIMLLLGLTLNQAFWVFVGIGVVATCLGGAAAITAPYTP